MSLNATQPVDSKKELLFTTQTRLIVLTRLSDPHLRRQLECNDKWEQGISGSYQDTKRILDEMSWLKQRNTLREYKLVSVTPLLDDDLPF